MTRVVNLREQEHEVYIGRSNDRFHFGNPASHIPESLALVRVPTRGEAVQFYADWLDGKHPEVEPERRHWVLHQIPRLHNKVLGCYCKPYPCHGDILAERADQQARKEGTLMSLLGFDTETERFGPGKIAPPMICASMSLGSPEAGEQLVVNANRSEMDAVIEHILREKSIILVGQNLAFDMAVLANHRPDWMPLIWQSYEDGRIKDVMLREKLLVLADTGDLEFYETPSGDKVKQRYNLAAMVMKYFGIDLSAVKDEDDAWRTNYDVLSGVPLAQWPADAVKYAIDDARFPVGIYNRQEQKRAELKEKIAGDPLKTEDFRAGIAFALQLLTCWGHRVDHAEKQKLEDELAAELTPEKLSLLVKMGILRPAEAAKPYKNGVKVHEPTCTDPKTCSCPPKLTAASKESVDKKKLTAYVERLADMNQNVKLVRTAASDRFPEGQISVNAEWLEEYNGPDPVLGQYKHRKDLQKLITTELPRMCYRDARGEPLIGPDGRTITAEVVHASYDALKSTGRTSSFSSDLYPSINDQNVDPRARRCYIPREGMLLWSVDFSFMELVSAAQVCLDLFGHSVLADKIKAGCDPHTYLGAQIAYALDEDFNSYCAVGSSREEIHDLFAALKKSENEEHRKFFKKFRTLAKPTGLGYPGGLGPDTFVKFSKPYATVDRETAVRLRETWLQTYPEFVEYFEFIKRACTDPYNTRMRKYPKGDGTFEEKEESAFRYISPLGMYRAGCDYCACANGQALQTPSAEGALLALFNVQRACYDPTLGSILYGRVRPNGFIHDEIVGEVTDNVREAEVLLNEVARIMVESFGQIIKDVPIKAAPVLMRRWDKAAESVFDAEGHLTVWEPK